MSIPIHWIVCKLLRWEQCEWECNYAPLPTKIHGSPGCVGFLEVYSDYETAVKAAGGDSNLVVAIRHKEQTGGASHE